MSTTMSKEQQDAMAKQAFKMMEDAKRTLEHLGLSVTPPPLDPRAKAPDGGPISGAHAVLPVTLTPTTEVYLLDQSGQPMLDVGIVEINSSDFDETKHRLVEKRRHRSADVVEQEQVVTPQVKLGTSSLNDLLSMTMDLLRSQPEVALLTEIPKDKTSLAHAILAARGRNKS